MDFFKVRSRTFKEGREEHRVVYPSFNVCRSEDLMVRGRSFYAIWDPDRGLWSTDEYDVVRLVDSALAEYAEQIGIDIESGDRIAWMGNFSTKSWLDFRNYVAHVSDTVEVLDDNLVFANDEVSKKDYASKKLPYRLEDGDHSAWDEIVGTLYDQSEREKIEWAIGAIVSGDSKDIQKFLVLYGQAGTGKSTILNIVQKLFEGYYATFEAKTLASANNAFATEAFRYNPLVAIQHDGDLSRIEDNSKLNSIISHEDMTINEKYKPSYTAKIKCFLLMGTNRPVKITDSKSGIIRRLIDVTPSGRLIEPDRYISLMETVKFQLGAIAKHCLDMYRKMGRHYYNGYKPMSMMYETDVFFNFVEESFYTFKDQDGTTLAQAYEMYKTYCSDTNIDRVLPRYKFREELKDYFSEFVERDVIDGKRVRSRYKGFLTDKFESRLYTGASQIVSKPRLTGLSNIDSILDKMYPHTPAQYAGDTGTPICKWDSCKTTLEDIDTSRLHYMKLPENHIVIDFDIKDETGEKSLDLNLEAAADWPKTYAEVSKSGKGLHLHYIYDGDVSTLSNVYSDGIEIKVFGGNRSLRRKLTLCNDIRVASLNSGLPKKKEKRMINSNTVKTEQKLRELILRNLRKEIHPGTKPSVDFIRVILDEAYDGGLSYDVTDMAPKILTFANKSSNHAAYCVDQVAKMRFKSDEAEAPPEGEYIDDRIVFYDVEVMKNLFVVVWKFAGSSTCVRMINPTPQEIGDLFGYKLVGFNNRKYDNHILYGRFIGYTNEQLYELSKRIIEKRGSSTFREAYSISYTDVYDFASAGNKMSLKKWQIKLGIHHKELGIPWDEPVPESRWDEVASYCENDVTSTEAVFDHLHDEFVAREILADIAGGTVNDTTNTLTTRIIFGDCRDPELNYPDISEEFPGYTFENNKNMYRGIDVGKGGYVYANPGMYGRCITLDVSGMHPHSILAMNLFGKYTENFRNLVDARTHIKHAEYERCAGMFDGKLERYLEDRSSAKKLSTALKTAVNSVYGLTYTAFSNPFRDPRNVNNIVALRGALFMVELKFEVEARGFNVVHIKTDSIKIENPTDEILEFVCEFGKKYGYTFEQEAAWEKLCLVNNAVFIGKQASDSVDAPGEWTAVGAQFAEPYVYKTLFSKESVTLEDLQQTKQVKTAIYLDENENLQEDEHDYKFVGRVGSFVPVKQGCNGGILLRDNGDGKYVAVTGSSGYRWMEYEQVLELESVEAVVDYEYYAAMADDAVESLSKYGDVEAFLD